MEPTNVNENAAALQEPAPEGLLTDADLEGSSRRSGSARALVPMRLRRRPATRSRAASECGALSASGAASKAVSLKWGLGEMGGHLLSRAEAPWEVGACRM